MTRVTTLGTWDRRDGKGKLSLRRQQEYQKAGITRGMYTDGYRLSAPDEIPNHRDVTRWSRQALEQTIILQWAVIQTLERKLA